MNKAVMISIQPKWVELIANGKKTFEVRKTKPKLETPFKVYIYCTTKGETLYYLFRSETLNGKVIGEFVCDRIDEYTNYSLDEQKGHIKRREDLLRSACMTLKDWRDYIGSYRSDKGYAWHISNLVIYDKPKELSEFWLYNEELHKLYESDEDYCAWGNSTTESGCPTNDCEGTDLLQCYQCWEDWSGWCHKLKRPFQSWGYVEEQE